MPAPSRLAAAAGAALLASACTTNDTGGALGIVAFDPTRNVASAEPLFSAAEDKCLHSPAFLLKIFDRTSADWGFRRTADEIPQAQVEICEELLHTLQTAAARPKTPPALASLDPMLFSDTSVTQAGEIITGSTAVSPEPWGGYSITQRNEIIDSLLATSDRKCGRYSAFLKTYDANINNSFGIGALIASALGAFVGGENTAQALAGTSAILNGSRSTINQTHFSNQTIQIIAKAYENARADQREEITRWQQCQPHQYTLMRGFQDAYRYHASCSIVVGLAETSKAVDRAGAPDLEAMQAYMTRVLEFGDAARGRAAPATTNGADVEDADAASDNGGNGGGGQDAETKPKPGESAGGSKDKPGAVTNLTRKSYTCPLDKKAS